MVAYPRCLCMSRPPVMRTKLPPSTRPRQSGPILYIFRVNMETYEPASGTTTTRTASHSTQRRGLAELEACGAFLTEITVNGSVYMFLITRKLCTHEPGLVSQWMELHLHRSNSRRPLRCCSRRVETAAQGARVEYLEEYTFSQ